MKKIIVYLFIITIAFVVEFPALRTQTNQKINPTHSEKYYYLKITESDGDIAVTAPIWVDTTNISTTRSGSPQIFNHYRGDLHNHTSYSDGKGTPDQAFLQAKNGGVDFFAITDHTYTHNGQWTEEEWAQTRSFANTYTVDGSFIAIAGWETAVSGDNNHLCAFNVGSWWDNAFDSDIAGLYPGFKEHPEIVAQWNHPTSANCYDSYAYWDPDIDKIMCLIEWYNAKQGRTFEEQYQLALSKGWHVAPAANSDDHSAKWITGYNHRTIILAHNLTLSSIIDGIRNRRVYASLDKNLNVDYCINNWVMGSILSNQDTLNFAITVSDPDEKDFISKIEIIADGKVVLSKIFNSNNVTWNPVLPQ
jgi:hypothetical protein